MKIQPPLISSRNSKVFCAFRILAPLVAALASGAPARANLTITPTFESSITSDPNAAAIESTIDTDIANIESYIANPITVPITFGEMDSGLGSSSTEVGTVSYASYLVHLEGGQTLSSYDSTALASLGQTAPYNGPAPSANPVNGSSSIVTTAALLSALGYSVSLGGNPESTIMFNPAIVNDSRGGPQTAGNYDLQSVIAHEMDEALGVGGAGSQLDQVAFNGVSATTGPVGPLDLFRYSGSGQRSYSTSSNVSSYFSINGGSTVLVHFNQNGVADHSDFADWGNGVNPAEVAGNDPPQVQDAYGSPNAEPNLGANELLALDVVGWNLTPAGTALEAAVPEPGATALCVFGAIGLLLAGRRLRSPVDLISPSAGTRAA